ncbi:MAG: ECF transporter S component [Candidatus Limnocylindrales bacterium]|jgi:energy-coupling factor transport system permease protein|nr:ECF transporter S component [Candidatus Limnocylindrales bacterium]
MTTGSRAGRSGVAPDRTWRTLDIVVVAVIAAAFGVFMAGFNVVYQAAGGAAGSPLNVLYGIWLLPAVIAPAIVRKPGAALFAELVAASLSVLVVNQWGPDAILSGFLQGLGAELAFALFRYRRYDVLAIALASVASAALAFLHDWLLYYQGLAPDVLAITALAMLISAAVLMPAATAVVVRALRRAGALRGFPA